MLTIQVSARERKILDELQRQIPEYCTIINVDYFDEKEIVEMVIKIVPAIAPIIAAYFGYLAGKRQHETIVVKIDGLINATITTGINTGKKKMKNKAEKVKIFLDELTKYQSNETNNESKEDSSGDNK